MGVEVRHPRCPYCHDAIAPEQVKTPCMSCMAWHHSACAEEHERCAACGRGTSGAPASVPEDFLGWAVFSSTWNSWENLCEEAS
ncbi:MAG: hypothetical protein R3F62_10595 [Planctomycetota bacterium]